MVKVLSIEITEQQNFRQYGALSFDDAVEVIEEVLGLNHTDIEAIQKFGPSPRRIDFSLTHEAFERDEVQRNLDESVRLSTGKIVIVGLPNQVITDVYVKYTPLEWSKERLVRIFAFYGDIKATDCMSIKESEISKRNYVGKANGIVKFRMKLRKPVPSTLNIDGSGIEVYYKNQSRTCWRCGGGHMRYLCQATQREFTNRFSIDDFPLIGEATRASESAQQQDQDNMDQDNMDQDASQATGGAAHPSGATGVVGEASSVVGEASSVVGVTSQVSDAIGGSAGLLQASNITVVAAEVPQATSGTSVVAEEPQATEGIVEQAAAVATEATLAEVATESEQVVDMEVAGAAEAPQANAATATVTRNLGTNVENDSEVTITASESEDTSQLTPGQATGTTEGIDKYNEEALMCEAAAALELQPTPIELLLSQDSLMDQDEENLTIFRSKKRTTGSSTEEENTEKDEKSTNGANVTPMSGSGKKKSKPSKFNE